MKDDLLKEVETRRTVAQTIVNVASQLGTTIDVDPNKLIVRPKFSVELTGNDKKISSAILDFMFPKEPSSTQLTHYTSLSALRSIATTNEIRLYPISKRVDEGELKTFAEDHKFEGYTDHKDGPPLYKEFAKDLFYISLSRENAKDKCHLWGVFGDGGNGVQLHFDISAVAAEVRPINYQSPARQLLKEVNITLVAAGCVPFIPWTISKIGAFYLPSNLKSEDEIRLLIKRHAKGVDVTKNDGTYDYWPIPLSQINQFAKFTLTQITCGPKCNPADVTEQIKGTTLANTQINPPK